VTGYTSLVIDLFTRQSCGDRFDFCRFVSAFNCFSRRCRGADWLDLGSDFLVLGNLFQDINFLCIAGDVFRKEDQYDAVTN